MGETLVRDSNLVLSTCKDVILHASSTQSLLAEKPGLQKRAVHGTLMCSGRVAGNMGSAPFRTAVHSQNQYRLNLDIPRASNARTGKYAPTILLMTSCAPVACQYAKFTCAMHSMYGKQAVCS